MNIFAVQKCPEQAARDLCDRHVIKMILESAQMLCGAFPKDQAPYKWAHRNHPCTIWARSSGSNYDWLLLHGKAMCDEYGRRYAKRHKTEDVLDWLKTNKPVEIPDLGLTPFAQAMPDQYKGPDAVEAYRKYYILDKTRFAYWKDEKTIPTWFIDGCLANGIRFKNLERVEKVSNESA